MIETLFPLKLPPGFHNNGTRYQAKGRWYTGNFVRFFQGNKQPIGGWTQRTLTGAAIVGVPNAAISWQTNDGNTYLAIGTTTNLYVVNSSNVVYDITPTNIGYGSGTHTWQLATFGTYLVAVYNKPIPTGGFTFILANPNWYVWQGDVAQRADVVGLNTPPRDSWGVVVTPEKFLVLLRGYPPNSAAYSPRTVFWPSQETYSDFVPSSINTAGSFPLYTDGVLICGRAQTGQTLLWTTTDLWAMTYIGGDLYYSFTRRGQNCGIVGQNAVVVLDSGAYWMGFNKFFVYNGFVKPIPCEVQDYVFGNFNNTYGYKTWALPNPQFGEITWFYPSSLATECDSYVTYNYQEDHWVFGSLARNAGVAFQAGATSQVPVLVGVDGAVYDHETGSSHGGPVPYMESGPIELDDGDHVVRIQRIVPDDKTQGDVVAYLYTSMSPDSSETLNGAYTLSSITSVRLTARQVRLKLQESVAGAWRVGVVRLGGIVGGRR